MLYLFMMLMLQPFVVPEPAPYSYDYPKCIETRNCAPAAEAVTEEGPDFIATAENDPTFIEFTDDGAALFSKPATRQKGSDWTGPYTDMWFDKRYVDGRVRKSLWRFWCENRKVNFIEEIEYSAARKVVQRFSNPDTSPRAGAAHVVPDSVGEAMMNVACSKQFAP